MRVPRRTLHSNIADKNNFVKIPFSPKFLLTRKTGFVPCNEWINTRLTRLIIDESEKVLDSGFHVVHRFLLWQECSNFGFLGDWIQIPDFANTSYPESLIWKKRILTLHGKDLLLFKKHIFLKLPKPCNKCILNTFHEATSLRGSLFLSSPWNLSLRFCFVDPSVWRE